MRYLIHPAVWLLNRLSFPRKLALVAALLILPLVLLVVSLVLRLDERIAFAERELTGIEAIPPLKRLTALIQAHRGTAQLLLTGYEEARPNLARIEADAARELALLDAHDRAHGGRLGTRAKWLEVKARWPILLKDLPRLTPEEAYTRHNALVASVNGYLFEIADASGLLLEGRPAPFYITLVAVTLVPELVENLGQARALSSRVAQRKSITAEERFQLSALIGAIQKSEANVYARTRKVYDAAPARGGALLPPLDRAAARIRSFTDKLRDELILASTIQAEGWAFYDAGTHAIDASYRLCEVARPTLAALVEEEAARLRQEKRLILTGVAVTLALAAWLFLGFTVALIRRLDGLRAATARIAAGDFHAYAVLDGHDELATIATGFNGMADSLRGLVGQLRQSEDKYRRIMEQAGDAILLSNQEGGLIDANRMAEHLLGIERAALLDMNIRDLLRGPDSAACCGACLSGAANPADGEHTLMRPDGRPVPVHAKCTLIDYGGGKAMLSIFRDISAAKETQRRIEHMATHDPLTGLANRALFYDRVRLALARAARQGEPFALMFIDLDNFKTVNDCLGHDAGDRLLKEVARRIQGCVRAEDTAARLGGDEFTLLIAAAGREVAAATARRIIEALAAAPLLPEEQGITVTASIGIALAPGAAGSLHTLLKQADAAMYRAKEQGKNGYRFHGAAEHA